MTEIRIRNGVPRNLPTQWTVYAWDAIRNDDNTQYTNTASAQYSLWDEWKLEGTFIVASTWGLDDSSATVATLYPQKTILGSLTIPDSATYPPNTSVGDITTYPSYFTTSWVYRGQSIALTNETVWGAIIQFNITTLASDLRQLLVTLGTKIISSDDPSWAAASMNYWYDASNQHDYFECRVGETVKKVKINQFQRNKPHLYAVRRDTSQVHFYVDSMLIASTNFPSGTLWTAENSTNTYNMWWYLSDYGYAPSSGLLNTYPLTYALFRLDMSIAYDHSHILSLCKSRYLIDDSAHIASTSTIVLDGSNIGVFGSSNFDTIFI